MPDILANVLIFTTLMLMVFVFLFIRTAIRAGGFKEMIAYYKLHRTYRDWLPLLWIPTALMTLLLLVATVTRADEASDISWLNYTSIHAGLEVPVRSGPSTICKWQLDSVDNRLTSNLGLTQHLVGWYDIDIVASYTHHSCAIDGDWNLYDGVGVQAVWTHYWN